MKGWKFATIEEIKSALLEVLKTILKSALRIGKNAGTSVLYLRGGYFDGDNIDIDE